MEEIEIREFEKIIKLSESIERLNELTFYNLLDFLESYGTLYNTEKIKLPYHINLIDEINADENAHSRILSKILKYKEKDNYPYLNLFLNKLCDFNLKVINPKICKVDSCGRIDIPIFDNDFVVIIENKITDKAPDQNNPKGGATSEIHRNC